MRGRNARGCACTFCRRSSMEMYADSLAWLSCFLVDGYCDPGATRTPDSFLRREVLYPLSYGVGALILTTAESPVVVAATCGTSPVAVGAPDLAFGDLIRHGFP